MDILLSVFHSYHNSLYLMILSSSCTILIVSILANVLWQILRRNPAHPPTVFHLLPFVGSAISYGRDPNKFLSNCQRTYGDIFTFVMFGKRITPFLGTQGNDAILNGKLEDLNAEDIYNVLTAPVWGSDVVYDTPHTRFMQQKKFVKFGLAPKALRSYVPLIENEIYSFLSQSPGFHGSSGTIDIAKAMSEIVIFTASRSLQGAEVREKLNSTFATNYHDLDMGFTPINFLFPNLPLPRNRRRDIAQQRMAETYMAIIRERRAMEPDAERDQDMIWHLMDSTYKDGSRMPDHEIAHLMIALLMAGQASSAVTLAWIMLHLAAEQDLATELLAEQQHCLASATAPLSLDDLYKLPLHSHVVRETLRLHPPVHSVMRRVTRPLPLADTGLCVAPGGILLASIGHVAQSERYWSQPHQWKPHRWEGNALLGEGVEDKRGPRVDYGYGPVAAGATSPFLPFGAGRHRCIGEQFTYLQLVSVVATMVREFEFEGEGDRGKVPATDYSSMVARPMLGAKIRWRRRQNK